MLKIDSVLVPMDFSEHSENALEYGLGLAEKFGADVHLLHCYCEDMFSMIAYGPDHVPIIPHDFEKQVRQAAAEKLSGYREKITDRGLKAESHLSKLVPSDAIVRTADELGTDLIVMGSHGLTGLKHVVLGSVAERTIRHASCPVLTVKMRGKKAATHS